MIPSLTSIHDISKKEMEELFKEAKKFKEQMFDDHPRYEYLIWGKARPLFDMTVVPGRIPDTWRW